MAGHISHSMARTKIYAIWRGMLTRCYNKNRACYKDYGERGIDVCLKWHMFEHFYEDMGPSYEEGLTLERIRNDEGYYPENCMWAAKEEQSKNRRDSRSWKFKEEGIASNTSGIRGVCWDKSRGKWIASICVAGKQRNLGRFDSKEEAAAVYNEAAAELRF